MRAARRPRAARARGAGRTMRGKVPGSGKNLGWCAASRKRVTRTRGCVRRSSRCWQGCEVVHSQRWVRGKNPRLCMASIKRMARIRGCAAHHRALPQNLAMCMSQAAHNLQSLPARMASSHTTSSSCHPITCAHALLRILASTRYPAPYVTPPPLRAGPAASRPRKLRKRRQYWHAAHGRSGGGAPQSH